MSDYAVVVKARMSSERLPGKALAVYAPDGTPNLIQIVRRWQASDRDPVIIVATTDGLEDGAIADYCAGYGVACFRGSRDDVTGRMDGAIKAFAPDVRWIARWIARGSADNPLVDVGLADWRFDILVETGADGLWYGGEHERITYAGTTDVWSRRAWDAIAEGSSGSQDEHPGGWFWDNLSRLNVVQIPMPRREYLAPVRTELDMPADLEMFRQLWHRMSDEKGEEISCINTLDALKYLIGHPQLAATNTEVGAKTMTRPRACRSCAGRARTGSAASCRAISRCAARGAARRASSTEEGSVGKLHELLAVEADLKAKGGGRHPYQVSTS